MMIGKNEMHLNTATMVRIVQEWIDRELPSSRGVVKDVTTEGAGRYDGRTFVVTIEAAKSTNEQT